MSERLPVIAGTTQMPPLGFSDLRLRAANKQTINSEGAYVLYWMIAARRTRFNFALQRAIDLARQLNVGLVIFEPLHCDYPYASDRLHHFIIEGMVANASDLANQSATYFPWVGKEAGAGRGLLDCLAEKACVVVTDDFPAFFLPEMIKAAAGKLKVRLEVIDGNGLLPIAAAEKDYPTAYAFRRFLHKALPAFIDERPLDNPLANVNLPKVELPANVTERWPTDIPETLLAAKGLQSLPIDHSIPPAILRGGREAATSQLRHFLLKQLPDYPETRNSPDLDCTSRLSPFLHFGHISVHQIFSEIEAQEGWSSCRLPLKPTGKRSGWWRMSEAAEAFLDELVTWRELAYGFCRLRTDYADYAGLPEWARDTLDRHASDPRPELYTLEVFATAATHDPLWNAAQRQLLREGRIHGYLRMLWGKKILEWSDSPQTAMQIMIELNDRYALDGRDPNSYSGISWCLGRFDRPWGPERPIFGKIRYMTSKNTARKVAVKGYLRRYGPESEGE